MYLHVLQARQSTVYEEYDAMLRAAEAMLQDTPPLATFTALLVPTQS